MSSLSGEKPELKDISNCLFDLEEEARGQFAELVKKSIEDHYKIKISDEDFQKLIMGGIKKPTHGRGEITIQCFQLGKLLSIKNSKQISDDLMNIINTKLSSNNGDNDYNKLIKKIESVNGYINVYLQASYLGNIISLILRDNNSFIDPLPSNNERVMIEYSQPNTHKAFHVGHMRNVALGDSLWRLFQHTGYTVIPVNYFGDEGTHVAKCLWLLNKIINKKHLNIDNDIKEEDRGEWLGSIYTRAVFELDLETYTKYPFPGVIVAKILSKQSHHDKTAPASWNIVEVEYGPNKKTTVVCGGTGYDIGDLVPYIPVDGLYKGKKIEPRDMKGIFSHGIIMSAAELGVSIPSEEEKETENENENEQENKEDNPKDKKSKKKQKKQTKKQAKPDDDKRIYVLNKDYAKYIEISIRKDPLSKPEKHKYDLENIKNIKCGDVLIEIGRIPDEALKISFDEIDLIPTNESIEKTIQQRNHEQKVVLEKLEAEEENEWKLLWHKTRKWSLDEFHRIYKWLGARFDYDFCESECSAPSREMVLKYYEEGKLIKSEGAIGINLEDEKLGFCMLLKSNGTSLYATKDLVLAKKKFDTYKIDRSIYIVDAAQSLHFKQVFATLKRLGYKQAEKCFHLAYGQVVLPDGKMSSRKGNVILFSQLKKKLGEQIDKEYLNKLEKEKEIEEINESRRKISVGTIRYGMLNHDTNKDIVFDLEKWTLSSGNTGPYLQYQAARVASISRNVEIPNTNPNYSLLDNDLERDILFQLSQFQRKIKETAEQYNPSALCGYLFEIAQKFSQWYTKPENNIKHCQNLQLKITKLQFANSIAEVLKKGLALLGIPYLERM